MSARTFGALVAHDGVWLVEYRAESSGVRVVGQWAAHERSASVDEAMSRLSMLVSARGARRPRVAIAVEAFGTVHHTMALPAAADDVLRPIVEREMQRTFGLTDAVVAFSRGPSAPGTQTQLFIAATPRATIDAVTTHLTAADVGVEIVTVVPKAMQSLAQASGASTEPTAVLACLEGGPHLAFFLDGRLELAIDPPIALEGERAPVSVILDQVERGAVYFRQQFRGATATQLLLSSPANEFQPLAASLEERLGVRVRPLFAGGATPEAVVAMGAVLEARQKASLDLFPHPPTVAERARAALRGPGGAAAGLAAAAVIAGVWAAVQIFSLSSMRAESNRLRATIESGVTSVAPMRDVAERRSDYVHAVRFINATAAERRELTTALRVIADGAPAEIRFDTVEVSRAASAWSTSIAGEATGATAAQAAGALDHFYRAIRSRSGISTATLDEFDYPVPSGPDSTKKLGGPVVIQFRLSFAIDRASEAAR